MTTLHVVKPQTEIANRLPNAQLTPAFKKKAEANDAQIEKEIAAIGRGYTNLGRLFSINKAEGLHVALGYNSFPDYCEAKSGKSKTQVYEAVRIYNELGAGDKPTISQTDLDQITQENAKGLVALKKKGIKITPKLVKDAKEMSAKKFAKEVVHPRHPVAAQKAAVKEGTTIAGGAEVSMRLTYTLSTEVAALVHRAAEVARYVTRDDQRDIKFEEKFMESMAAEYLSTYLAEYEEAKMDEEAHGINAAVSSDAANVQEEDEVDESLLDPEDEEEPVGEEDLEDEILGEITQEQVDAGQVSDKDWGLDKSTNS